MSPPDVRGTCGGGPRSLPKKSQQQNLMLFGNITKPQELNRCRASRQDPWIEIYLQRSALSLGYMGRW